MKKELKREIEESQNLPGSQRRKKYNDKTIRIKSGKTFTKGESLTRNQRRELLKDKDILKELLKIIKKYFPELTSLFSKLTDKRHKSYITYKMKTDYYD